MSGVSVKICGLRDPAAAVVAAEAGARYVGLVFHRNSPRNVDISMAAKVAAAVPPGVAKVALTVNADDSLLREILDSVPIDMLQLHGDENPARVQAVRSRFRLPVMKAIGIAEPDDLAGIESCALSADQLLIDAKPTEEAALPGGNGLAFDWRLLRGHRSWRRPWMLAGGLTPDNVAEAIRLTGARQVDVSSGVESAPGVKDPDLIRAFLAAARPGSRHRP